MKKFGKPDFGYSGSQIEEELLGEVARPIRLEFKDWRAGREKFRMSRTEMYRLVKNNQPEGSSPTAPDTSFAYDTQSMLVELLQRELSNIFDKIDYVDLLDRIQFFTAVNSPMDYALGIDAFFEIYLDDDFYIEITLDASGRDKEDYKADILIHYPEKGIDPQEDKAQWQEFITQQSQAIIEEFKRKLKNHDVRRIKK